MSNVWHPDEELLIPWLDGELDRAQSERVSQHLADCAGCSLRVAQLREVPAAPAGAFPPPPQPWIDLKSRLKELDAGHAVQRRRRPSFTLSTKWMAAAAALVVGAVVIRLATEQTVSAAELLRDAAAVESTVTSPSRKIRVKTKRAVFTRPASGSVDSDVAHLFREAGYSWDEPLSARSFSGWRGKLTRKDDRVKVLRHDQGRMYRITTSTTEGALAEASITLRAADLRAVDGSFRFRNEETVEISEETAETPASGKPVPVERLAGSPTPAAGDPAREATPSDELRVLASLHSIGADLGEPIEVKRGTNVIAVTALVTDAERQAQIRSAVGGLPLVSLQFEQPDAVRGTARPAASEAASPKSNALIERLTTRLGGRSTVENFTNHVMDLSEAALARAHALRGLAERFPTPVESALSAADARTLASLRENHATRLLASVRQLNDVLKPVARADNPVEVDPYETWQAGSETVLSAAQGVDRTLTNALAGSGDVGNPDEALNRLARAAAELDVRVAALQTVLARRK